MRINQLRAACYLITKHSYVVIVIDGFLVLPIRLACIPFSDRRFFFSFFLFEQNQYVAIHFPTAISVVVENCSYSENRIVGDTRIYIFSVMWIGRESVDVQLSARRLGIQSQWFMQHSICRTLYIVAYLCVFSCVSTKCIFINKKSREKKVRIECTRMHKRNHTHVPLTRVRLEKQRRLFAAHIKLSMKMKKIERDKERETHTHVSNVFIYFRSEIGTNFYDGT